MQNKFWSKAADDDDIEDWDSNGPGWVCLMIFFSPFDGSPLLNYWSTKRSIDGVKDDHDDHEDDNDDEGREDDNKRVCRGAPLVITLSSIVGIGTAYNLPQRTYN